MKHTTCFLAAVAALAFASDGQCAEAASGSQPSAPKTYCNPMPLPGIPVNSGCRNGKPSRTPGSSYREIADPSFLYDNGTLYLYPSMGMAWKSKDCGATWEQIDVGVYDLGYAPTAVKHRGKYYLTTGGSQLHVADSPEGPFKPIGRIARPKVDGKEMSYDDPMLFSDDDERLYVYFGCSPRGGIWGIELDSKNPLAFIGEPKQLIKFEPEEHPWECKPNNLGEAWMEGSWMIKINGRYCLVYSPLLEPRTTRTRWARRGATSRSGRSSSSATIRSYARRRAWCAALRTAASSRIRSRRTASWSPTASL